VTKRLEVKRLVGVARKGASASTPAETGVPIGVPHLLRSPVRVQPQNS